MNDTATPGWWEEETETRLPEPPAAIEAERALLGILLLEPERLQQVAQELEAPDFTLDRHRWIFTGMRALGPMAAQLVPLGEWLRQQGVFEEAGGLAYLTSLEASLPSAGSLPELVRIIKDRAWRRRLHEIAARTMRELASSRPTAEVAGENVSGFRAVLQESHRGGFRQLGDILEEWLDSIEEKQNNPPKDRGLTVGIPELDEILGGLERRHMWLVAARPGVGKTSLLLQIAAREALDEGRHVAVFSLEMDEVELVIRLACQRLGLDGRRAREGRLAKDEWTSLIRFARECRWRSTLHVDQQPRIDPGTIAARVQELASRVPLSAVFIDYLTLIKSNGGGREDKRYSRVAEIAEELAALAKTENVKMVVAAQLSRDSSKGGRKPRLADLREAGEEPAWGVVLVHREERADGSREWLAPETECIVAKNRTGQTGVASARFHGPTQRFLPEI
jgi:replicative DNA helicase